MKLIATKRFCLGTLRYYSGLIALVLSFGCGSKVEDLNKIVEQAVVAAPTAPGGGGTTGPTATLVFTPSSLTVPEGTTSTLALACTSTEGGTPTFAVGNQSDNLSGVGANCSIVGNNLSCTPRFVSEHATWTGTARVYCNIGSASTSDLVTINVTDTNRAPSLPVLTAVTVDNGAVASIDVSDQYTLNDTDRDGDTITYSCDFGSTIGTAGGTPCSSSAEITFNTSTGELSYDPPNTGSVTSTRYFRIGARDNYPTPPGLTDSQIWAVTTRYPPVISSLSPSTVAPGDGLIVTGSNFDTISNTEIDLISSTNVVTRCPRISMTATTVQCTVPSSLSVGTYSVRATNQGSGLASPDFSSLLIAVGPDITSIDAPAYGPISSAQVPAATITLRGTNFITGARAYVNSVECSTTTVVSPNVVTCVTPVPALAGTYAVSITNFPSGFSDTFANGFSYQNPPTVTARSPASGPRTGGNTLTLTGTSLSNVATVTINGVSCPITLVSATSVTCNIQGVAAASGPFAIRVTNNDGQFVTLSGADPTTGGYTFTSATGRTLTFNPTSIASVLAGVTFTSIVQIRDSDGNIVTNPADDDSTANITFSITGASPPSLYSAATPNSSVSMNAVSGEADFSSRSLSIRTAGTYTLQALKADTSGGNGSASSTATISLIVNPQSLSLTNSTLALSSSSIGIGNDVIVTATLRDLYGNAITNAGSVTIEQASGSGSVDTNPTSASPWPMTGLGGGVYTATLRGATSGTVLFTVKVDGVSLTPSSDPTLTVNTPVTVTSVVRQGTAFSTGAINTALTLTVTGTGFNSTAGNNTVTFGTSPSAICTPTAATTTTITCTVASNAVTTNQSVNGVTVTVANTGTGLSNTLSPGFFFLTRPTITAISSATGSVCGGTVLTITGTYLRADTAIDIGGFACTSVNPVSLPTQIQCTTGVGSNGVYNIIATNTDGQDSLPNLTYTYTTTAADSISFTTIPSSDVVAGATFNMTATIRDSSGFAVCAAPDANSAVTLTRATGTGTLLGSSNVSAGVATAQASSGVVSFASNGLYMQDAGDFTFTVTKPDNSGSGGSTLRTATSGNVRIVSAPLDLSISTFTVSNAAVGVGRTRTLTLNLRDAYGNPFNTLASVSVAKVSGAGTASFGAAASLGSGQYTVVVTGGTEGALVVEATVNGVPMPVGKRLSLTVVPLLSFTLPSNRLPPITGTAATDPLVQGTSVTITPTAPIEIDGLSYTFGCTYETPAMGSSDPSYVATATNCTSLPSYVTTNGVTFAFNGAGVSQSASFDTSTGALTWNPRWDQRGVFKINLSMTSTNGTVTQSYYVAVREPWDTTNLSAAMDAGMSTGFTDFSGVPFSPAAIQSNNASTSWLSLVGGVIGQFISYASSTLVWQGTGAASTSSVSPYALNLQGNGAKIDTLSIDSTVYNASTDKTYISLWVRPTDVSTANQVIASNRGGSAGSRTGVTLRQSVTSGKVQLQAEPISFLTEVAASNPKYWFRFEETAGTSLAETQGTGLTGTVDTTRLNFAGLLVNDASRSISPSSVNPALIAHHEDLTLRNLSESTGWSIELVVNCVTGGIANNACLISKNTAGVGGWILEHKHPDTATGYRFRFLNSAGATVQTISSPSRALGSRRYIVLTYTPGAPGVLRFNLNPIPGDSSPVATDISSAAFPALNNEAISFSTVNTSTHRVDEFAFYTRPLTETEILTHSAAAIGTGGCTTSSSWISNTWNHLAAVLTASGLNLYMNGRLECSASINYSNLNSGAAFTLGNYPSAGAGASNAVNFNGQIAEARIYNQAVSASETAGSTITTEFMNSGNRYREMSIPNIVNDSTLALYWDAMNSLSGVAKYTASTGSTHAISPATGVLIAGTLNNIANPSTATSGWNGLATQASPYFLKLDGSNDSQSISNAQAIAAGVQWSSTDSSFSVSKWLRLDVGFTGTILSMQHASNGWATRANSGATWLHLNIVGGSSTQGGGVNVDPRDGAWHNVTQVYDGPTKTVRIYIDGTQQTALAITGGCGSVVSNALDFSSCASSGTTAINTAGALRLGDFNLNGFSNGAFHAFAIYNKALTQAEVRQNCLAMRHRFPTGGGTPSCAAP